MTALPSRTLRRAAAACLALGLSCAPALAAAQPAYDLTGDRTIDAISALRGATPSGAPTASEASRLELARTATDLWLVSFLEPDHDDLGGRVAHVLGVPPADVPATLRAELEALETRRRIAAVEELLTAISLARSLAIEGSGVSFAGTHGLRRDALFVDAAARAVASHDRRALAAMLGDPCAGAEACGEPWSAWGPSSRGEIASLLEASAAAERLHDAAIAGEPFARATYPLLAESADAVEAYVVQPVPRLAEELPCASAQGDEEVVRTEVLVAIGPRELRVGRVSPVRVSQGELVMLLEGEDVLPRSLAIPLRTDRRDPIAALGGYLRRAGLEGARVAIAASNDVPARLIGRVLASIERADATPSVLVRRAPDGSLRGVAMTLVRDDDIARDVLVRPRTTGYRVRRGERALLEAPNEEALWHRLATVDGDRVLLEASGSGSADELYDAAFRLGRAGSPVALVTH